MVRIVAAALRDPTIGVAAQLATMPREPTEYAPPVPDILDEVTSPETARDEYPNGPGPYLQVGAGAVRANDITVVPNNWTEVSMGIRYLVRSSMTDRSLSEARQTERAIRRVLAVLPQQADALKLSNHAQLFHVKQYAAEEHRAPSTDVAFTIVMSFTVTGRDLFAMNGPS